MSLKSTFNNDWYFSKQPLHTNFEAVATSGFEWMPVTIPHDWLIYDSNNLYENSVGWYRKTLQLTELDHHSLTSLYFEGVYMDSTLFINGQEVGTWKNGYSSFELEITPYLIVGNNEIYVQVIHQSPNSRWYSGAGIYRSVWMKSYPKNHIVSEGTYITTEKNGNEWTVDVASEVVFSDQLNSDDTYKVRHQIINQYGTVFAEQEVNITAEASNTVTVYGNMSVSDPLLWDIISPNLYRLRTELLVNDATIDTETQNFGFRTTEFDNEQGFFLNGRHVKIYGVCQHHDLGSLGAAVNKVALRRQISLLQEMGVNAIRTAHNVPAVELMDLADEMGILIVSELFDMWERPKNPYDFARFYPEWWQKDVASWVRRDRNHPSMLMWSIGNEIYDTHADERGQELSQELLDEVLLHDPNKNAVVTIGSNYMPWENAQKCADIVTFAGYNYAEKYYDRHHEEHPDWVIYGSETASTVQSRGIYHFPLAQSVLADDDEQCSALGNSSTSWGAKNTEYCITADRDATFSLGQFIWTGFDYIGEPTPYHTKNSYFGQLDTAGFKKDSFYIYQAEWTNYKVKPMVHIFPYWDFSEGQLIDIRVCSNAPKIELFFNEVSQGTYLIDHAHGQKLLGEWQIPYTKGVLRAVAYDENDIVIAIDIISSFGDATSIVQTPDKTTISADGSDLIFIEISTADVEGHRVENANNRVHITIDGPGRLVGLDNGDSTDYDSYKGTNRKLFSGKLLAIVASTLEEGTITVRANSNGLPTSELTLTAVAPEQMNSDSEQYSLYSFDASHKQGKELQEIASDEIPVRKIEILCPQGNKLNAEQQSIPVQVKLYPSNATYQDVQWRITNVAGVDANLATIETNGHNAVITALGDGDLYIRCGTTNGSDSIKHYSLMEINISGLGQAFINPYEFVSAGYHSEESRNLTNGNERGVATAREGESIIYFDKIDFGSYGSDEITLPIFSLDSEYFTMDLWEGYPYEPQSTLIATVPYHKTTIWNVYQPETYSLSKRLQGVSSLAIVLNRKIHLKGFQFTKINKAFEQLRALDHNHLYGDSFTITEEAIENIGNNVSIIFEDMDFGEAGTNKLTICGHSPIDKNTINILFSGDSGDSKQLVEFSHSDDYTVREFNLDEINGKQTVTFVFLPGSQFNLNWFKFQ
ncbi:glycoside hydrolase family 2 TIM barrel-domain containing protein [Paenibacillus endoradicis]|uniref:glycoside hydrolase family 2 TIM barrel-domain containing protein n=1 Tax=Paenibacillus endoradicis TaxID=2972487 RepID=UPI0021594A1E|nr:glycoside hydrolase family 2 TIM barrel-domain containing protein [Paenibacillus endoradicis]MCR8658931.1 DUF4982 domain-containing protein [Paenibacillus endoradicis]